MTQSKQEKVSDPGRFITKIYVEQDVADHPMTREILARAPHIPVELLTDGKTAMPDLGFYPKSLSEGKRHLLLARNRGRFLSRAPAPGNTSAVITRCSILA